MVLSVIWNQHIPKTASSKRNNSITGETNTVKFIPRQINSLFLLLLACTPLLYTVSLQLRQRIIQFQMQEKLEMESLISISIPKNKINWHKKNKELIHNNRLFDVKSVKADIGNIVFTGLYDDDETILTEKMKDNGKNNSLHQNMLVEFFHLLMGSYHSQKAESEKPIQLSFNFYVIKNVIPLSPYISFNTPPPKNLIAIFTSSTNFL